MRGTTGIATPSMADPRKRVGELSDDELIDRERRRWSDPYRRSGGKTFATPEGEPLPPAATATPSAQVEEPVEQRFKIQFAVGPQFMERLEEVRSLLSTRFPKGLEFEKLFKIVMDEYLDRHSPQKRMERREARGQGSSGGGGEAKTEPKRMIRSPRTRHIPASVRDEVFLCDRGRCSFAGSDGVRCSVTRNLQIDHIVPRGKGGDNSLANLRLLCAKHNRLEAERAYGKEFMQRFCRVPEIPYHARRPSMHD